MSFLQYGNLIDRTTVIATAGTTTTLINTSSVVQIFTGSLTQTIVLPNATTFATSGNSYRIYNQSSGPLTLQFNGGASFTDASGTNYSTISPHTSLFITLQTNGTSAGTWSALSSGSGASSGSGKNYLSGYTASTSSGTPNPGNGNFELGSTSGWSLAHSTLTSLIPTSTATPGSAFSASSGGTAASGNLSFSLITSGQLAGLASGSLVSSAASVAGDMLISSAFFIDKEDEAKMMQGIVYYNVNAGVANVNLSGTSSNTFSVYIYDVTNGAWIQPAGVYNFVQNSGTGKCTFTFQTTSNSTQYQVALIQPNASAGSYSLYVDDFFIGPQIAPSGPVMGDWIQYTPLFTGLGTVTTPSIFYSRVGDTLHVQGTFTTGTPTATTVQISLPSGLTMDTTKLPSTNSLVGEWAVGNPDSGYSVIVNPSVPTVFEVTTGASNQLTPGGIGNVLFGPGELNGFFAKVPIAGWSSNTVQSSDTDTRVVQFNANGSPANVTSGNPIIFPSIENDTHASYNSSTGRYTVPVSGIYVFACTFQSGSFTAGSSVNIYKNGFIGDSIGNANANSNLSGGSGSVKCNTGDIIDLRPSSNITTFNATATNNTISIYRLSGPAVISSSDVVSARVYPSAATQTVPNTVQSTILFNTITFDTHGAFNTSTNTYLVPVSGKYSINVSVRVGASGSSNNIILYMFKNGSIYSNALSPGTVTTSSSGVSLQLNDQINCLAGDTIFFQILNNATGGGVTITSTSGMETFFNISRLGGTG